MTFKKLFSILAIACTLSVVGTVIPATPAVAVSLLLSLSSDSSGANPITGAHPGDTFYMRGVSTGTAAAGTVSIASTPSSSFINTTAFVSTAGILFADIGYQIAYLSFTVPAGTPRGTYTISATGSVYNGTTTLSIKPRITLSPTSGPVGSTLTVSGDGFTAFDSVRFYLDGSASPITDAAGNAVIVTAGATGSLAATPIPVPATYRGQHVIIAADTVGPTDPMVITVASALTITPAAGGSGDTVAVKGSGFGASNQVSVRFDSSVVSTVQTDTNGSFGPTNITIPTATRGAHTISAQDSQTVSATFTVGEKISVYIGASGATTGGVGDNVTITGSGYDFNQAVQLYWDVAPITITPAPVTGASGNFTVTFPIPPTTKGAHTVRVQVGTVISTGPITVSSKITSINPTSGQVSASIKVSGTGFTPSSSVAINFDGASAGTLTIGDNGSFTDVPFTIPASAAGAHTINIQGVTFSVTTTAKITLSPGAGVYNDDITITGSGFTAASSISLSIDSTYSATSATITTAANGSFSATFKVPNLAKGSHAIKASDAGGASSDTQLTINPKVTMTPLSGTPGVVVGLTGTGFAPIHQITVTYNGAQVTTNPAAINTDAYGYFSATYTVIPSQAGTITVAVNDGTTPVDVNFTAMPSAKINPITSDTSAGYVGQDVTVSGTGFKSSATVSVTLDNLQPAVASTTSDAQGSFTVTFKAPAIVKGNHSIKVSDGTTTQEFTYIMESSPPPVPLQVAPVAAAKPKQPVTFTWGAVTDLSGVTYQLQLSQDPQFGTLIKEWKGLTTTSYTMTVDEKLASAGGKNPYQWRVRAIDAAGNMSAWSEPRTFNIGLIWPSWMIHVWYGFGILIALILGLWLGRRMAYQSY